VPSLKQLEDQGRALLAKQKSLVEDDARPWPAKKSEFDKLDVDVKAILAQAEVLKSVDGTGYDGYGDLRGPSLKASALARSYGVIGTPIDSPRISLTDEQITELADAGLSMKSLAIECKATDSSAILPAAIPNYRLPPVTMLREPTRVLDLIPTVAVDNPIVTYYTTTGTAAAAAVAEGGTKPTSTLSYSAVNATMTKLAHVAEVTDETLRDFPAFSQALTADMQAGLIKAENAELLTATVTGAHKFAGLLNASGILTRARSTENQIDTVSLAFDDLRNGASFAEPDAIVFNPTDWGNLKRLKDGNQRYYIDPSPASVAPLTLWGKKVVLTTQMTAGTALVGSFGEGAIAFVRDGIRVEMANQGTTQFTNNTVLVRCEERLTVGVVRPTCFVKVTGL
jgi:HK97 family phage major capsid protein